MSVLYCTVQWNRFQVTKEHVYTTQPGRGVIIDRHHGEEVGSLPHDCAVACAANLHAAGTATTASEDGTIRRWTVQ
jgi:hypothetical protein